MDLFCLPFNPNWSEFDSLCVDTLSPDSVRAVQNSTHLDILFGIPYNEEER